MRRLNDALSGDYRRRRAERTGKEVASTLLCSSGFTLIELLVVIAIIGILAAIALPNYTRIKSKAKEAEVKSALHDTQISIERFASDNDGTYPPYLIGGDNRALVYAFGDQGTCVAEYIETPAELCSDHLLRNGYVTSYPRNPFISEPKSIQRFQQQIGDPLRSSFSDGQRMGTRFGADCNVMGQTLCESRWVEWYAPNLNGGEPDKCDTWANIQYEFYDVWLGNMQRPFVPGSFMYKAMGDLLPSFKGADSRKNFSLKDPHVIVPQGDREDAVYPTELNTYILGAWGGTRTKGMDILGEEPLVYFSFKDISRRAQTISIRMDDFNPGDVSLPPPSTNDTYKLLGIPPWTRGVNRSHIGPLWGSPYGPSRNSHEQLTSSNPNGLRDALILILTP